MTDLHTTTTATVEHQGDAFVARYDDGTITATATAETEELARKGVYLEVGRKMMTLPDDEREAWFAANTAPVGS